MAHIQNTMIKKKLAEQALDVETPTQRYFDLVQKARTNGFSNEAIIAELEDERARIMHDIQCGDALFLKGVENAQSACIVAIDKTIAELNESVA